MASKIDRIIFILIFLMILQSAFGQTERNIPEYIKGQFQKYIAANPREEIFVHTDREEYIAGENLWFNIYLIDRQSFKASMNSKIAYFELLNSENRPIVQKRILLNEGLGPGEIQLPDSLSPGTYTIRAYTSWMRNFLPYNCFMKDIRIYNSFINKPFREKHYSNNNISNSERAENTISNQSDGITINVNNRNTDNLQIDVITDDDFLTVNNKIYILIQTHGVIDYLSSTMLNSERNSFNLSKKILTSGINQILLFDSRGHPLFERLIYTPSKNIDSLVIRSNEQYMKRSKISLGIDIENNQTGKLELKNLSISVIPHTDMPDKEIINDYLIFGTEYGFQPVGKPGKGRISEYSYEEIDSILLNVKSNWIDWTSIMSGSFPQFKYNVENKDHYLLGKLFTNDQSVGDPDEIVVLCTPGKEAVFQYARTDNEGNFSFRINIDEDLKDLIIMPDDVSGNHKILIQSSFSDQYLQTEKFADTINMQEPIYILDWSTNYQVRKIYKISEPGPPLIQEFSSPEPLRFYGKPDIELYLSDYIALPTMEEIFFELLPRITFKKNKSGYELIIADRLDDSRYVLLPTLMIDGVPISDASLLAGIDPAIVEKIDVIKGKYFVGDYSFSGIVNVITKSGDFRCVSLPDYMIRLPYEVISNVPSFRLPDYSTNKSLNSRIPDFRNTLYWNPLVRCDKSGKIEVEFWSSDNTGEYDIIIHGITSENKMVSQRKILNVK